MGRFLRRSGVLLDTEVLDWEIINEKGAEWLGSMPVGPTETLTFYVAPETATVQLEPLYAALCRACTPLPSDEIAKGLATLLLLCKVRAMENDDIALTMALFKDKLAEYPADVVVWALSEWPEHHKFFPAWAELKRLVLVHCWARMRMRDRLGEVLHKRREND